MTRRPQLARILIAGLCFLLALFLCVEASHGHPLGAPDGASHCQLCLLAHATALPAAALALYVAFRVFALALRARPRRGSPARIRVFLIRPPPVLA